MSWMIRFAAAFAIVGLIISVSFGLIAGNGLTHVLITGVISMLLSGALGTGVYRVLDLRVPEFVSLLDDLFSGGSGGEYQGDLDGVEIGEGASGHRDGGFVDSGSAFPDSGVPGAGGGDADVQVYGDHIMVNKVPIKNEPKLIAQAIRTMLSKDE